MNLTENFTLEELIESPSAKKAGFKEQLTPSDSVVENLRALCVNVLQPVRDLVGIPIDISSGYRCERLNKAVGGAVRSQHLTGEAADIKATSRLSNRELLDKIRLSGIKYDQLINEYPVKGEPSWIHISFSKRNRGEQLVVRKVAGRKVTELIS